MTVVAGVDPSLTSSGVVVGNGAGVPIVSRIKSGPIGDSPWARIERCRRIANEIKEILDNAKAERIFIEGYAFAADYNREALAELGGIIRLCLLDIDEKLREVQPSALKKFVTAKGNARKPVVIHAVRDQWGFETSNSDEADAYGLWRLGLCVVGNEDPVGIHQIEAVDDVKAGPKPRGKRKPKKRKKSVRGLF